MERLPDGHPSASCHDDGSRKSASPDLAKYELPPPGELPPETAQPDQGFETAQPDQDLPAEDKPRIDADGSWHWKGHDLVPERARIADQAHASFRDLEGRDDQGNYGERGLTPAMRRIEAQLEHGSLVKDTEKFALKDPDRFKEKFAERVKFQPDERVAEIAARIHDGVRYTFEYDDERYTDSVYRTESAISEHGFDLMIRKPRWNGLEYKGVNTKWRDPDSGLFFEVQFHTHASWEAKQKTHPAYEKLADPRTPAAERPGLEEYQRRITASVPVPPGALEIPYYRKEGA